MVRNEPSKIGMDLEKQVSQLLSRIVILRSNPHYRMGDVIYRKGLRYEDSTAQVLRLDQFNGTILKDYIQQVENIDVPDLPLLVNIAQKRISSRNMPLPQDDELVIHVRAGDTVELEWYLKKDYQSEIEKHLPSIKSCAFVICYAFQEFHEKDWWMFSYDKLTENMVRVKALFLKLLKAYPDIEFKVVSNTNIDDDFCYMARSSYFVPDEGGFSALIWDIKAYQQNINTAQAHVAQQ